MLGRLLSFVVVGLLAFASSALAQGIQALPEPGPHPPLTHNAIHRRRIVSR